MSTELCRLFEKYGSDKAKGNYNGHSYSTVYYNLFKDIQFEVQNLLEIGVGNKELMNPLVNNNYTVGASLKGWRDFFINANVFSFDIRDDVLFEDNRIKCFYANQSCCNSLKKGIESIFNFKNNIFKFDLIIDDGSHILDHQKGSLLCLSSFVKPNRYYIVEDVKRKDLEIFKNLNVPEMKLIFVHEGERDWDGFVMYEKN